MKRVARKNDAGILKSVRIFAAILQLSRYPSSNVIATVFADGAMTISSRVTNFLFDDRYLRCEVKLFGDTESLLISDDVLSEIRW